MAAYSGCGERDGGLRHGERRSRTGMARVLAERFSWLAGGSVADRRRQAGNGRARNRARARLNWVSQGQRWGRCKVRRRAEWVSRPAREKNRRRRVLVVTICSPSPSRAVQRARLWAITLDRQPGGAGGETARLRDRRSLGILENPRVGGFT